MTVRDRGLTTTRWLLMVALQVPGFLSLQSCKNDRTEPVKTEAEHPQRRAVFGSVPDRVQSEIRPRTSKDASQPATKLDKTRVGAKTNDGIASKPPAAKGDFEHLPEFEYPAVKDPG